jgi:hypothetical protein
LRQLIPTSAEQDLCIRELRFEDVGQVLLRFQVSQPCL